MELIDVSERYADRFSAFDPKPRVWQCSDCGCLVRQGQPHIGLKPRPHEAFDALLVTASRRSLEAQDGSHGEMYVEEEGATRDTRGRRVTRPLVQGEDGLWREERA